MTDPEPSAPMPDAGCDCRSRVDADLKDKNARLAFGFTFDDRSMEVSPPIIATEKLNPRGKKPPIILATFCPFCGCRCDRRTEAQP